MLNDDDSCIRYSEPASAKITNALTLLKELKRCFYFSVVCADLIRGAKEKNLKVKGPVRMPTKVKYIRGERGEHN